MGCATSKEKKEKKMGCATSKDQPGGYTITQLATVTEAVSKDSRRICDVEVGTRVRVLEVVQLPEEQRVRGRLEDPAGWISLLATDDGSRWAEQAMLQKLQAYLVDNSALNAASPGLGFRKSKKLEDRVGNDSFAAWGTTVRGVEESGGWVKVDDAFLPLKLQGKTVLLGQEEKTMHEERKMHEDKERWTRFGGREIEALLDHTSLIDVHYLISLAEAGGIVPRCQDIPESAKIGKEKVWRLQSWPHKFSLPVLVLSYPWLERDHPDPLGEQLRKLLPIFKGMLAAAKAGSKQGTVGVFMDFPCLPQKPYETPDEKTRFDRGLRSLNEWYMNKYTHVLLVDDAAPRGADYTNSRPYSGRGWCMFERCVSGIKKDEGCLWSLTRYDGSKDYRGARSSMRSDRAPPTCPARFAKAMRSGVESGELAFTASADMEMVIKKYEQGFISAFDAGGDIFYCSLGWKDEELRVVIEACRYAAAHCTFPNGQVAINVMNNPISEEMEKTLRDLSASSEFRGKIRFEF